MALRSSEWRLQPDEKKALRERRAFLLGAERLLLGADDLDLDATIGLQALDELPVLAGIGSHVAAGGLRLGFALAFGVDAVRLDALADQVILDGLGPTLGQLLVVLVGADAVSVADRDDDFQRDLVELCLLYTSDAADE